MHGPILHRSFVCIQVAASLYFEDAILHSLTAIISTYCGAGTVREEQVAQSDRLRENRTDKLFIIVKEHWIEEIEPESNIKISFHAVNANNQWSLQLWSIGNSG